MALDMDFIKVRLDEAFKGRRATYDAPPLPAYEDVALDKAFIIDLVTNIESLSASRVGFGVDSYGFSAKSFIENIGEILSHKNKEGKTALELLLPADKESVIEEIQTKLKVVGSSIEDAIAKYQDARSPKTTLVERLASSRASTGSGCRSI